MWKYREPFPEDFDSDEEYEEALATYESACDAYEDKCRDRYYERKYES